MLCMIIHSDFALVRRHSMALVYFSHHPPYSYYVGMTWIKNHHAHAKNHDKTPSSSPHPYYYDNHVQTNSLAILAPLIYSTR